MVLTGIEIANLFVHVYPPDNSRQSHRTHNLCFDSPQSWDICKYSFETTHKVRHSVSRHVFPRRNPNALFDCRSTKFIKSVSTFTWLFSAVRSVTHCLICPQNIEPVDRQRDTWTDIRRSLYHCIVQISHFSLRELGVSENGWQTITLRLLGTRTLSVSAISDHHWITPLIVTKLKVINSQEPFPLTFLLLFLLFEQCGALLYFYTWTSLDVLLKLPVLWILRSVILWIDLLVWLP